MQKDWLVRACGENGRDRRPTEILYGEVGEVRRVARPRRQWAARGGSGLGNEGSQELEKSRIVEDNKVHAGL